MITLLLLYNIVFMYFFYFIWLRYLWVIPLLFIGFVFMNIQDAVGDIEKEKSDKRKETIRNFAISNILLLSWSIISWWLIILFYFQGLNEILSVLNISFDYDKYSIILYYVLGNLIMWICSYVINYNDWKRIFHFWFYFTLFVLLGIISIDFSFSMAINIFVFYMIPLITAIYAFQYFIVWAFRDISYLRYIVFIFFNIDVFIFIFKVIQTTTYIKIFYLQIYLFLLYLWIFLIKKLLSNRVYEDPTHEDKLQQILQTWKLAKKKTTKSFVVYILDFINNIPDFSKLLLGLLNLIFILIQIYLFAMALMPSWQGFWEAKIYYEITYWLAIILYIINFFILKSLNFSALIQRIFLFVIVNFSIYLTIMNFFRDQPNYIVIIWVWWNILNSIIIFYSENIFKWKVLFKEDYYLWILTNFLAMLVNLYFMNKLPYDESFIYPMMWIYWWVYLFISIYNMKYIDNMKLIR